MYHYVYRIDDPITKEFYIGSRSCKTEIENDKYMGSYVTWKPQYKSRLIKTILKSNFRKRETCIKYEAKLIKEHIDNELNRNYYIPHLGFMVFGTHQSDETIRRRIRSRNGYKHSEETKKKISIANKGNLKISAAVRNREVSIETRKKMSENHADVTGNKNPNFGKIHTDETKHKISECNSGLQKRVKCPHCNLTGGISNMKRYHFNNCRNTRTIK